MSAPERTTDPRTAAVVRALDDELHRLRVPKAQRLELAAEVRADLAAAVADGQDPIVVVGDVGRLARDAMDARGIEPRPREPWSAPVIGLLGGTGALAAAYALTEVLHPVLTDLIDLPGRYPVVGPVLVFGLMGLAALAGMIGAVALVMQGRHAGRETVRRGLITIPAGAALGCAAAYTYATRHDFDTTVPVVNTEIALVAVPCLLGIVAARAWGLHTVRRRAGVEADDTLLYTAAR